MLLRFKHATVEVGFPNGLSMLSFYTTNGYLSPYIDEINVYIWTRIFTSFQLSPHKTSQIISCTFFYDFFTQYFTQHYSTQQYSIIHTHLNFSVGQWGWLHSSSLSSDPSSQSRSPSHTQYWSIHLLLPHWNVDSRHSTASEGEQMGICTVHSYSTLNWINFLKVFLQLLLLWMKFNTTERYTYPWQKKKK